MNTRAFMLVAATWIAACAMAHGQLQGMAQDSETAVFGGSMASIPVLLRNPGASTVEIALKTRVFQMSSSTVMPLGAAQRWKRVTVLGGQTILESAPVEFPVVRGMTRFEVRWLDDTEEALGRSLVTVYPTNFGVQLAHLIGEKPPGVFDPHGQLTPLLRAAKIEFVDLTQGERLTTFQDGIAILGPFNPNQPAVPGLRKRAPAIAARGVNVVLAAVSESEPGNATPRPVKIVDSDRKGRLVIVPNEAVSGLSTNALAQQALLQAVRLAQSSNLFAERNPIY